MIKRFFPLTAAALMALSACSDDSSSSPSSPSQSNIPSGPSESDVPSCSAKKKSSNSVEMIYSIPEISTSTITTTLMGEKVQMDIFTKYSSSAPLDSIRAECEENKLEALEDPENSSVTCTDRTITIKSTKDSDGISFEKLYEKAVGECQVFEKMFQNGNDNNDDEEVDDIGDKPVTGSSRVGCMVLNDVENEFRTRAVASDSITIETVDRFSNDSIYSMNTFTFGPKVSQSEIDNFCEDLRTVEIYDSNAKVSCEDNIITFSYIETDPYSNFKQSKDEAIAECNLIQQKGSFNTEDDDGISPDDE